MTLYLVKQANAPCIRNSCLNGHRTRLLIVECFQNLVSLTLMWLHFRKEVNIWNSEEPGTKDTFVVPCGSYSHTISLACALSIDAFKWILKFFNVNRNLHIYILKSVLYFRNKTCLQSEVNNCSALPLNEYRKYNIAVWEFSECIRRIYSRL